MLFYFRMRTDAFFWSTQDCWNSHEKQNKKKQKMRTLGKVVSKLESKISKRYYQMFEQTKGSFYYVFTMRSIRSNFGLN